MSKLTLGDEGFAVIDNEIIPFRVDFIGKNSIGMEDDNGKFIESKVKNFFLNKKEAERYLYFMAFAIISRECPKNQEGPAIVTVLEMDVDYHLLSALALRSRYNPELQYFVVSRENIDDNLLLVVKNDYETLVNKNIILPI